MSADNFPAFNVTWMGRQIWVTLNDDDGGSLALRLVVGRVPSTASRIDDRRREVLRIIGQLHALLPDGWNVQMYADHRVALASQIAITMPSTITEMVTALTVFLLTLGPYLELLDGAGLASPARAGVANT
jgi:hypothetical protein